MNGWIDAWMGGWMNEWMDGLMHGWMNECMNELCERMFFLTNPSSPDLIIAFCLTVQFRQLKDGTWSENYVATVDYLISLWHQCLTHKDDSLWWLSSQATSRCIRTPWIQVLMTEGTNQRSQVRLKSSKLQ